MKNHVTKIIFVGMILMPVGLFVLLPHLGVGMAATPSFTQASFLDRSERQLEIVYFGYAGCSYICPRSLFTLGEALDSVHARVPDADIGAFFVDINAETQIRRAHEYGSAFSPVIRGIDTNMEDLNSLKSMFGLNAMTGTRAGDEILHPDIFFVVKRTPQGWQVVQQITGTIGRDNLISILTSLKQSPSI